MRLADYIERDGTIILDEWVAFAARRVSAAGAMDTNALRDHAAAMLSAIVADLRTPQTDAEQEAKGTGDAPVVAGETAAEIHGAGRAERGFSMSEMVSEYRALRASVVRNWTASCGELRGEDLEDLMRFNESIDQSLAESTERFSHDLERSREIFVAILGHDLRSPLGAVVTASQFMLDTGGLVEPNVTMATRVLSSARRMNLMVSDLLDFTRGRLGAGIPVVRVAMDLGAVVQRAVEEVRTARPGCAVQLTVAGDVTGSWDPERMAQVMSNLLGNAIAHGSPGELVAVSLQGEAHDVVLRVHNTGTAIPAEDQGALFSPFKRLAGAASPGGGEDHLGLGLYIVERVVAAHGGQISVRSSEGAGTLFTVRVPR